MEPVSVASICRTLPTPTASTDGIFVLRRVQAMAEQTDVTVYQPIPYFPVFRPLAPWADRASHVVDGLEIKHSPMFYFPKLLKSLDGTWLYRSVRHQLGALKRENRLDAIDAHFGYPDGVGALRIANELSVPAFITVRGVESEYLRTPSIAKIMLRALQQSDGCICVSHSLREMMVNAGVDRSKIRVIHNAVDRDVFMPRPQLCARKELDLPATTKIVVSVGNLLAVKRHDILIRSLVGLLDDHPDTMLVIIGAQMHEPTHSDELMDLCESLGVAGKVIFAGRLEPREVSSWLAAADVFALASQREGCCNALLEALACGLPCVVTSVGDNPRFVSNGDNGYIVPTDDILAMTQALLAALGRTEWDSEYISSTLGVGSWNEVAGQVLTFMRERIESRNRNGAST